MRDSSAALRAFLSTRPMFWSADLFTLVLSSGTVLRWASSDFDVVSGGTTWSAMGPVLTRTAWSAKNTMDVPTTTLRIDSTGADVSLAGAVVNLKQAVHQGLLDGATMSLQRAIMPSIGDTSLGLVNIFRGSVGRVVVDPLGIDVTVRGLVSLLQSYMPRNTYQLGCCWQLYGPGCQLSRSASQMTATVTSADPNGVSIGLDQAIDPGFYQGGTIYFPGGGAAGSLRTLRSVTGAAVLLSTPLLSLPAVGDSATLTRGCDRTRNACTARGNIAHHRGFPYIPPAETGL